MPICMRCDDTGIVDGQWLCPSCGGMARKSDRIAALEAQLAASRAEVERLREALETLRYGHPLTARAESVVRQALADIKGDSDE